MTWDNWVHQRASTVQWLLFGAGALLAPTSFDEALVDGSRLSTHCNVLSGDEVPQSKSGAAQVTRDLQLRDFPTVERIEVTPTFGSGYPGGEPIVAQL